jgi:hypothetical protein
MGGGIGEVQTYVSENSGEFEGFWVYQLTFFFLVNSIGLNMLFGIIIDSFGNLREREWDIDNDLANNCLVCSLTKTDFETRGIDFHYHTTIQHNIEDYVSYMIRLLINSRDLMHDIDYEIYQKVLRFDSSWFPAGSSLFMPKTKYEVMDADDMFYATIGKKLDKSAGRANNVGDALRAFEKRIGVKGRSTMSPRRTILSPEKPN